MQDCNSIKKSYPDRFILNRHSRKHISQKFVQPMVPEEKDQSYQRFLNKQIFQQPLLNQHNQFPFPHNHYMASIKSLLTKKIQAVQQKPTRKNMHLSPEKVLDAPEIRDDYYLNLLDWSSKGILSIGLGERVYLYSPTNIRQLVQKDDQYICSLSSNPQGQQLAVGLSSGKIELYDINQQRLIRTLRGHTNRVSSSSFTHGLLFTGSKDTKILGHDYRSHQNISMKFQGHRGQVCGLKHDPCGLASGSNDNQTLIWDLNNGKIRYNLIGHTAAVKALAWCPWQRNLLATGGGTNDQTMRFWNIQNGKLINTVNTESQVCALIWNKHDKQILSSHGFSQNQLSLWKYPKCTKIADFHGHSQRVLHMVMAPDNNTICTASADQTLRFWKVFQSNAQLQNQKTGSLLATKTINLR